jgi:hypothetical protein
MGYISYELPLSLLSQPSILLSKKRSFFVRDLSFFSAALPFQNLRFWNGRRRKKEQNAVCPKKSPISLERIAELPPVPNLIIWLGTGKGTGRDCHLSKKS